MPACCGNQCGSLGIFLAANLAELDGFLDYRLKTDRFSKCISQFRFAAKELKYLLQRFCWKDATPFVARLCQNKRTLLLVTCWYDQRLARFCPEGK